MEFSIEEYDLRSNKARKLMERDGLDGLFVTGGCSFPIQNFRYFTGVQPREGTTNTTHPYVFLLPKEGEPIVIVREMLAQDTSRQTWVKDIRGYAFPFPPTMVKEAIIDLNLQKGKIGAELGLDQRMHMPFLDFQEIKNILPEVEFADGADIFWELRMIKTKAEIDMVKESCRMACSVFERLFDWLREGMSIEDIYRKARIMQIEEGARISNIRINAGQDFSWTEMAPTRAGTKGKTLEKGDLLWIDSLLNHQGYWTDFVRMGVVGSPSDKQKKQYELLGKMVEKTTASILPGLPGKEILKHVCEEYRKLGVDEAYIDSSLKYPFRLVAHGMGLDPVERPYIYAKENYVIQPGMTLAVEPCGGFPPDFHLSLVLEENILVTEHGPEVMTRHYDSSLHII
jgi:Xaa-Pro aminopeptidase